MLAFGRYRLPLRPSGTGSAPLELQILRGAWGARLRAGLCETRALDCHGCVRAGDCGYRQIFDPVALVSEALDGISAVPPAYVLQGAGASDGLLQLEFALLGEVQARLPIVVETMLEALRIGIGPTRQPFFPAGSLQQLAGEWMPVESSAPACPSHTLTAAELADAAEDGAQHVLGVQLLSPLRLQQRGKLLGPDGVSGSAFVMAAARRIGLLAELYGAPLGADYRRLAALAGEVRLTHPRLRWSDGSRWSARQGRAHPMGGVVGTFSLEGPLGPFLPFLRAARWLHVGKNAPFGLGRFEMVPDSAVAPVLRID